MSNSGNKKQSIQAQRPPVFVTICYEEIYDDYLSVNPLELLRDVPTVSVLKFVAEKYASVFYAQSDISGQKQHIRDFCPFLPDKIKKRVWGFIKRTEKDGNHVFIYGSMGCQMMYRLALQHYVPIEEGDDIDLCFDEYEPVFKAVLYCNSKWTNQQLVKGDGKNNLLDLSLKMDIPIAESKHYKDFKSQLYKANQFYVFCENDDIFRGYLPFFLNDKGVDNWGQYLSLLFNIYYQSIHSTSLPVRDALEKRFLSQLVINQTDTEVATIWDDGNKGLSYLRNHFLYELPNGKLLLLDANLLIDKFYQGLKFDLFKTVNNNGLLNARGKQYKDQMQFNATLGEVFSERHLLYALLDKIYSGGNAVKFTGADLKQNGIDAEPDYYIRIGDTLFVIEYKDVLFPDRLRYSDNVEEIKQGILDRLCRDDGKESRKGGGQLLFFIDRVFNKGLMDALDSDVSDVKIVFPLLITTDSAFSALGVNSVVAAEFNRIRNSKYKFDKTLMIYTPVVVNFDSIISLSYRLNNASLQLNELLFSYVDSNWQGISSFDNYVWDECKESEEDRTNCLYFLLGDMVKNVEKRTSQMSSDVIEK